MVIITVADWITNILILSGSVVLIAVGLILLIHCINLFSKIMSE